MLSKCELDELNRLYLGESFFEYGEMKRENF